MKKNKLIFCCILTLTVICSSCKKFLDEKPNEKLTVPATLQDLQALLDDYPRVNANPGSLEIASDDYYLNDVDYAAQFGDGVKRIYRWEKDNLFYDQGLNDWNSQYRNVYYANTVFETLQKITPNPTNQPAYDNINGQAFFLRGKTFLEIASIWSLAYNEQDANTNLGIPLRLNTDFNEPSTRPSVAATYSQIEKDMLDAAKYLPLTAIHVVRPSRAAAFAMLARLYLYMGKYEKGLLYADSSLQLNSQLLNYNSLSQTATFPFSQFNVEVLYSCTFSASILTNTKAKIDSQLIASYNSNDLRKILFYRNNGNNTYGFKGSYEGSGTIQHGPTVGEMYLTRAECNARLGNTTAAVTDINTLLLKRWKTNTYTNYVATTATEALVKIIDERRKELVMRGLRWMDIKRLNRIGGQIVPKRIINGQLITLPVNDLRYAMAIPEDIILLSGMPQNPR